MRRSLAFGLVAFAAVGAAWALTAGHTRAPKSEASVPASETLGRVEGVQIPARGEGRIAGRVLAADSGTPLRSAHVRLASAPGEAARVTAETLTDDQGRYQFMDLPRGRYTLAFAKAGFVPLRYGQRHPADAVAVVDLDEGQVLDRVDAALPRGGAIEGRVVDEHGEPFAEVTVSAWRLEYVSEDGEQRLTAAGRATLTNDRGQYRLYGLPPGTYYVSATPQREAITVGSASPEASAATQGAYAPVFHPAAASAAEAQRVAVRAGEDAAGVDIVLRPVPFARVSGVVVSSRGQVQPGTFVTLVPARGASLGQPSGRGRSVAIVKPDGTFVIERVPPGEYVLQATSVPAGALERLAKPGVTVGAVAAESDAEFGSLGISVAGVDVTGLTVPLAPGGRLRGVVVLGDDPYRAGGAKPAPAVRAIPAGPQALLPGPTHATLGPDGTFAIWPVAGPVILRASGLPAGVVLDRVEHGGRDVTDAGLVVPPGEEVSDVRVVLTAKPWRLAGRVRVSEGTDATACRVVVFADDAARWVWPATRYVASVEPGASGTFELIGLPLATYRAVAVTSVEPGEWRDPLVLKELWGRGVLVRAEAGVTRPLELTCQGR